MKSTLTTVLVIILGLNALYAQDNVNTWKEFTDAIPYKIGNPATYTDFFEKSWETLPPMEADESAYYIVTTLRSTYASQKKQDTFTEYAKRIKVVLEQDLKKVENEHGQISQVYLDRLNMIIPIYSVLGYPEEYKEAYKVYVSLSPQVAAAQSSAKIAQAQQEKEEEIIDELEEILIVEDYTDSNSTFAMKFRSGHSDRILMFQSSLDEKYVLTASLDGTIRYWETITGRELVKIPIEKPEDLLNLFILNQSTLAYLTKDKLVSYNIDRKEMTTRLTGNFVYGTSTKSGQLILCKKREDYLHFYNTENFQIDSSIEIDIYGGITSIALNEDESIIAIGTDYNRCFIYNSNGDQIDVVTFSNIPTVAHSDVILNKAGTILYGIGQRIFTSYDIATKDTLQIIHKVDELALSQDEKYLALINFSIYLSSSELSIWDLENNKKIFSKKIEDINLNPNLTNSEEPEALNITFRSDNQLLFIDLNGITSYDFLWHKTSAYTNSYTNQVENLQLISNDNNKYFLFSLDDQVNIWNLTPSKLSKQIIDFGYPVRAATFSPDASKVAISIKEWQAPKKLGNIEFKGFLTKNQIWDIAKHEKLKEFGITYMDVKEITENVIHDLAFAPNSQKIFWASDAGYGDFIQNIESYDVVSGEKILAYNDSREQLGLNLTYYTDENGQNKPVRNGSVFSIDFNKNGNYFLASFNNAVALYETGNRHPPIFHQRPRGFRKNSVAYPNAKFDPSGEIIGYIHEPGAIALTDISFSDEKLLSSTPKVLNFDFSSNSEKLFSINNAIELWDIQTNSKEFQLNTSSPPTDIIGLDNPTQALSTHQDGSIHVWDFEKDFKKQYTMHPTKNENEYLFTTDMLVSGESTGFKYYLASKETAKNIYYVNGANTYGFDQFDLLLNRPDKVVKAMGADAELIDIYYKAYRKRLSKMGFEEQVIENYVNYQPDDLLEAPTVKIDDTIAALTTTSNKSISIPITAEDPAGQNIERLFVSVNDVPLYGTKGKRVRQRKTSQNIDVALSPGINTIGFKVLNQEGIYSFEETITVLCEASFEKPDLILVNIGASVYQDSNFNLEFASKDALDIQKLFESQGKYREVKTIALINEDISVENISAVKDKLNATRVNDHVIIFYAGHGVLDANFNYFLSTHNMDFNNPSNQGLPYETLENLLDEIPARNKLLLIDACHSGEVDKEDLTLASTQTQKVKNLTFRGEFGYASKSKALGLSNSFELMKELFNDVRNSTGSEVISSAGGVEFALESDSWSNGVFTYSLINGIKTKAADKNADGKVHVSELKAHIFENVVKLTNGMQNPTSRKENLENDFIIWEY